jgi:hypothetical protein
MCSFLFNKSGEKRGKKVTKCYAMQHGSAFCLVGRPILAAGRLLGGQSRLRAELPAPQTKLTHYQRTPWKADTTPGQSQSVPQNRL